MFRFRDEEGDELSLKEIDGGIRVHVDLDDPDGDLPFTEVYIDLPQDAAINFASTILNSITNKEE